MTAAHELTFLVGWFLGLMSFCIWSFSGDFARRTYDTVLCKMLLAMWVVPPTNPQRIWALYLRIITAIAAPFGVLVFAISLHRTLSRPDHPPDHTPPRLETDRPSHPSTPP